MPIFNNDTNKNKSNMIKTKNDYSTKLRLTNLELLNFDSPESGLQDIALFYLNQEQSVFDKTAIDYGLNQQIIYCLNLRTNTRFSNLFNIPGSIYKKSPIHFAMNYANQSNLHLMDLNNSPSSVKRKMKDHFIRNRNELLTD